MSRRSVPYPTGQFLVRIPGHLWDAALEELRRYGTLDGDPQYRGSEGLVFFGGLIVNGEAQVTSLYCLDHEPQGGRVQVTPDEARWLLKSLRARDEKLIAQVHSHRGLAGHSWGDDQHATSFHDGFVSIVIPYFAHGVTSIDECAVLEYRNGTFVDLPAPQHSRCRVEPAVIRRRPLPPSTPGPAKESRWQRSAQRLKSIARKQRLAKSD